MLGSVCLCSRPIPAMDTKIITFGKHKGSTYLHLLRNEESYCSWANNQENPGGDLADFIEYLKEKKFGTTAIAKALQNNNRNNNSAIASRPCSQTKTAFDDLEKSLASLDCYEDRKQNVSPQQHSDINQGKFLYLRV